MDVFLAKYDVSVGATSNTKCRQFLLPVSMSNLVNYCPPSSQEYELTEVLFNEALVPLWVYRLMKLPNDVILISVHTGREARSKLKEESRENKERCEELREFYGRLEEIMEADEQHNNQQDTGTKLL